MWIMLGECQSKCLHIAGTPLLPETAKKFHTLYVAKGILATTAIEGNTMTEEEVLQLLEGKLRLPPSREYQQQEIANIVSGCNMITEKIHSGEPPSLSLKNIKELNRFVLQKLQLEEKVVPGEIRTYEVGVARYKGAPHEDCTFLVEKLCDWLNREFTPPQGLEIVYAIIKAILAHLYLAWIHPFGDGNGRTARLVEFQILLSSGVPAPAAHLLSNHYNGTRTDYYRQLDATSRSGGELTLFFSYAIQGFVDGLRAQIEEIKKQQWEVTWKDYVYEFFRDMTKPSDQRLRDLLLDISKATDWIDATELESKYPRVAAHYAQMSNRTLVRDIFKLENLDLIEFGEEDQIRAKKEKILAFLPIKAK